MAKAGNESATLLSQIREEKTFGTINKRFTDEYFALDLLRIFYDDSVDGSIKTELLIAVEEYGCLGITAESVDQVVSSLLDIYHQCVSSADSWSFVCQSLITCTSLVIQLNQLETDTCTLLVKELVSIVTNRVNQPDSERLRSCACQCLIHLEEFQPGLLFIYHDEFSRLAKQERTYVFQDYMLLAAKVFEAVGSYQEEKVNILAAPVDTKVLQKQMSYEVQDVRQLAAYIIENVLLFTRCGSFRIIQSLAQLVKQLPEISPIIFKPLMLHQMATMSGVLFHTVLYLQREFPGEILTLQEEGSLVDRLCIMVNHPCLTVSHRLLIAQWMMYYQLDINGEPVLHENIVMKYRHHVFPSVFDPVNCQISKLYLTSLCGDTSEDTDGIETSILLASLGCLHKLVWHTGNNKAAIALFKALYFMYLRHNNRSFSQDIQRFVRGLISEFPCFIPHSVDFINCIHELGIDSQIYVETLRLLHQQIVMATEDQVCQSYQYYLQIMKEVAMEKQIEQQSTLKFLQYLADKAPQIDNSSWTLGHGVLDICRNLLVCHGSYLYHIGIGDLLQNMLTCYANTDVRDQARQYYALMTRVSNKKMCMVLQEQLFSTDTMGQALSSLLLGTNERVNLARIITLDQTIFSWNRVSVDSANVQDPDCAVQVSNQESGDLEHYQSVLSSQGRRLQLKYQLKLAEACEFNKIYAVTIHMDTSHNYITVSDTKVPCLSQEDHLDVLMTLKPKLPLPETFTAHVDFMAGNKQTYTVKLPSIPLDLQHLFHPLPWQPACEAISQFFNVLWNWVLHSSERGRKGIESIKIHNVTEEAFQEIVETQLKQFSLGQKDGVSLFAMMLPPQYHVLFRCHHQQSDRLVISMVMDMWNLLPHVDKFLNDIMNS